MDLTSPIEIKRIMDGLGRSFNKALGQNFLIDRGVLDEIIASSGINKDFGIIEIGPGIGTLTMELAKNAKKVVCIELDRQIAAYLEKAFAFYDNVKIINGDALKVDFKEIIDNEFGDIPCAIVANLPYYITTPLIMKFLESGLDLESVTVMIQKEVAERLVAESGTKDYGAITCSVNYYSTPEIITIVPPDSFMPPPKVTSAVIKLDIKNHTVPYVSNPKELFKIIKASFGQRRKTLVNGLSGIYPNISKDELKNIIFEVSGNENIRGEQLSLSQFIEICEKIVKIIAI